MFGLKTCNWCDTTLWWWKESYTVEMKCLDGKHSIDLCESCQNVFEQFNEYVEDMKEKQDETIRSD